MPIKPASEETVVDNIWGEYPDWEAMARLIYGRRMWRLPEMRARA